MKRLIFLSTVLVASTGLAQLQVSRSHDWQINFPSFAYLWINVGGLTFDFSDDATSGTIGYLANRSDVYDPTLSGLLACLNGGAAFSGPSGAYTGVDNAPTAPNCRFAPEIASGGTPYTVVYEDADNDGFVNYADADLFIVSSGGGWRVDVQITGGTVPGGMTLEAYPYVWDSNEGTLEAKDGSDPGLGTGSAVTLSGSVTTLSNGVNDKGYYVSGRFWMYLQPINFALVLNPNSVSVPINNQTLTVQYTVNAP